MFYIFLDESYQIGGVGDGISLHKRGEDKAKKPCSCTMRSVKFRDTVVICLRNLPKLKDVTVLKFPAVK